MNLMVAITYISIISASVHWVAVTVSFISNRFTFLLGKKKASSTLFHFSYHHFSYPVLSFSKWITDAENQIEALQAYEEDHQHPF